MPGGAGRPMSNIQIFFYPNFIFIYFFTKFINVIHRIYPIIVCLVHRVYTFYTPSLKFALNHFYIAWSSFIVSIMFSPLFIRNQSLSHFYIYFIHCSIFTQITVLTFLIIYHCDSLPFYESLCFLNEWNSDTFPWKPVYEQITMYVYFLVMTSYWWCHRGEKVKCLPIKPNRNYWYNLQ